MTPVSEDRRSPAAPRAFLATGGWVIVLALLVTAAAFAWTVRRWMSSHHRAVGDGSTVASYGFPLDPCLVPPATLVASGMPKDGLQALTDPEVWPASRLEELRGRAYRKLLLGSDPVAGVEIDGITRAYPLRFLAWHEVVNDSLGGLPIAVTYHPISGGVVVFRRDVAGETLEFGVSGLLADSGQVLYDRRKDVRAESLWGQLALRAIAGPAAAERQRLEPLPVTVAPWSWWLHRHPDTTLLAPVARMLSDYRRDPFSSYFGSDLLRYPVAPLPTEPEPPLKTPVVIVRVGDRFHAFLAPFVTGGARSGSRPLSVDGNELVFHWAGRPTVVWVEQPAGGLPVIYSLLFAWYALQAPNTTWHGLSPSG